MLMVTGLSRGHEGVVVLAKSINYYLYYYYYYYFIIIIIIFFFIY